MKLLIRFAWIGVNALDQRTTPEVVMISKASSIANGDSQVAETVAIVVEERGGQKRSTQRLGEKCRLLDSGIYVESLICVRPEVTKVHCILQ